MSSVPLSRAIASVSVTVGREFRCGSCFVRYSLKSNDAVLKPFPGKSSCREFTAAQNSGTRQFQALSGRRRKLLDPLRYQRRSISAGQSMANLDVKASDSSQKIAESNNHAPKSGSSVREDDRIEDHDYGEQYYEEAGDYEDETQYKNLASPLFSFITTRVSAFNKLAPTDTDDYASFKSFWRSAYDRMRVELSRSNESSLFITKPPLQNLEIEIVNDETTEGCPCMFDGERTDIVIQAEGGITRDIFLKSIRDQVYGEDILAEKVRLSERHCGMVVPKWWNYMSIPEPEGEIFYYGDGRMRIWMYCSDRVVAREG